MILLPCMQEQGAVNMQNISQQSTTDTSGLQQRIYLFIIKIRLFQPTRYPLLGDVSRNKGHFYI